CLLSFVDLIELNNFLAGCMSLSITVFEIIGSECAIDLTLRRAAVRRPLNVLRDYVLSNIVYFLILVSDILLFAKALLALVPGTNTHWLAEKGESNTMRRDTLRTGQICR